MSIDYLDPFDWPSWKPELLNRLAKPLLRHPVAHQVKRVADAGATAAARIEEWACASSDAVILPGFTRPVQGDSFTCAVQCAYAVLGYYGRACSPSSLMRQLGTTAEGTDTGRIVQLLRGRRLRARVFARVTLGDLRRCIRAGSPVIVATDRDHVACVYGYDRASFFVADPAVNRSWRVRVRSRDLAARLDGWAVALTE